MTSIENMAVENIRVDPNQPRRVVSRDTITELASSIEASGLLHPITVRTIGDGTYMLVAGERRFRAVQSLGWATVPAVVRDDLDDADVLWVQVAENMSRSDLSPIDEAEALSLLIGIGASHAEVARRLGVSKSVVTQRLRLLTLPPPVRALVGAGRLSEGHARELLRLKGVFAGAELWLQVDDLPADPEFWVPQLIPLLTGPLQGVGLHPDDEPDYDRATGARVAMAEAVSTGWPWEQWHLVVIQFGVLAAACGWSVATLSARLDELVERLCAAICGYLFWDDEVAQDLWLDLERSGLRSVIDDFDAAMRWITEGPGSKWWSDARRLISWDEDTTLSPWRAPSLPVSRKTRKKSRKTAKKVTS